MSLVAYAISLQAMEQDSIDTYVQNVHCKYSEDLISEYEKIGRLTTHSQLTPLLQNFSTCPLEPAIKPENAWSTVNSLTSKGVITFVDKQNSSNKKGLIRLVLLHVLYNNTPSEMWRLTKAEQLAYTCRIVQFMKKNEHKIVYDLNEPITFVPNDYRFRMELPLMSACEVKKPKIVEFLLKYGAKPAIKQSFFLSNGVLDDSLTILTYFKELAKKDADILDEKQREKAEKKNKKINSLLSLYAPSSSSESSVCCPLS
jgi:hypothetical protein